MNKFVVTDLNEDAEATVEALQESFDEQLVAENSSGGTVATVKDRDYEGNVKDEKSDGGFDLGNYNDDGWAAGVDDYYSGDDSGIDLDEQSDKDMKKACNRYEENSGGFIFSGDGKKIILECGQLYKNIDEFRKMVKELAIQNGFRLQRIKNEKSRVTLKCAATSCIRRIHASPNWKKRHFQIKTFQPNHTCERNNDNHEANSIWIAVTFLHFSQSQQPNYHRYHSYRIV